MKIDTKEITEKIDLLPQYRDGLDNVEDLDSLVYSLCDRIDELESALSGLMINKECFCGVAIGNPMYSDHSSSCKAARAALEGK